MIIPYDRFDLLSGRPPGELVEALHQAIRPALWARSSWTAPNPSFEGKLSGNSFECWRIINYAVLAFFWMITTILFHFEAGKAVDIFVERLDARPFDAELLSHR